jgi:phosphatidylglycerophosphate synthase
MDLHRVSGKSDWAKIPRSDYNYWQQLASKTNSYVTPGNVVTMIGFFTVLFGLWAILYHHYWLGVVCLIVGRFLDIVDGWVANKTGTKSSIGESLDAGFDKLGTVITIGVFFAAHTAPAAWLIALLLPHLLIALATVIQKARHVLIQPSRAGKLSMATAWFCLVGFVIAQAGNMTGHSILTHFIEAIAAVSVTLGLASVIGYLKLK